jgi:hypothetical protein
LIRLVVIPGRRFSGEPGIHNPNSWLWIPGPRAKARVPE